MDTKKKLSPKSIPPKDGCVHFFIRDVPEDVHRKAKSKAALLGISLREFVVQALQEKTESR